MVQYKLFREREYAYTQKKKDERKQEEMQDHHSQEISKVGMVPQ